MCSGVRRPAMSARLLLQVAILSACAACTSAFAQTKAGAAQADSGSIEVTAQRTPVDKSYRKMIDGMDFFERKHAMAPGAELRFKLLPRKRDSNLERIELQILGDSFVIPVDVAPDHTFTVPRERKALDENASVRSNRKALSMTWRTEIRTPGLPPGTRRLGDLRLECQVAMVADLISNVRSVFDSVSNFVAGMLDYCNKSDPQYYFFSDRPLFSVALVAGARREVVPVDRLYAGASHDPGWKANLPYCDCEVLVDRTYFLPLGDRSWPDDTRVEIEYMDDGK